jgi:hypothetical protein
MKHSLITFGLVSVTSLALLVAGCTVTARPATVHVASAYGGWSPTYYNGNLMYYNYAGRPYYYSNNIMVYVPSTWSNYNATVSSWQSNQVSYNRWHARYHAPRYYTPARKVAPRRAAPRPAVRVRHTVHPQPAGHERPAHDNRPEERKRHKR